MTSRWKNYALWLSMISFVALLPAALSVYDINLILPGNYNGVALAFLAIFVAAGLINSPTSTLNLGFLDGAVAASPWRNVRVWVAVFSFIALLPQALGVYNLRMVLPGNYGDITNLILGILTSIGFLYVPTQNSLTLLLKRIIK